MTYMPCKRRLWPRTTAVHTLCCCAVQVCVASGSGPSLRDVIVSVTAALPLTTHPSHFVIPEVSSMQQGQALVVTVVCTPSLLPTNTGLQLSATYQACDGNQWSCSIATNGHWGVPRTYSLCAVDLLKLVPVWLG